MTAKTLLTTTEAAALLNIKEIKTMRELTEDEQALLTHISRWGSDGYPIIKFKGARWTWGPFRSVNGPPTIFKTKREAVESFERFMDVLREASGELARERYLHEHGLSQ